MNRMKKQLKRYQRQADEISRMISFLTELSEGALYMNFQNLRGRTDLESTSMGVAIIARLAEVTLGMKPYPVQIIGALALIDGNIAEMQTGEGKTLTASMAIAWHALHHSSHVMTVNDYLAKRDYLQLEPLYRALGLSCSYLEDGFDRDEREIAYRSDVIYAASSQFVFDYLRDQMVLDAADRVQKKVGYLIIDEADSILIDEARTPMILSGEGIGDQSVWSISRDIVSQLSYQEDVPSNLTQLQKLSMVEPPPHADITINVHAQSLAFTEQGMDHLEALSIEHGLIEEKDSLWRPENAFLVRSFTASAKARLLFLRDHHYIVKDDKAIIIDTDSGRLSKGKRWNDGLHQAIEAKEGLTVRAETVEIGRISLANYIDLYPHTAGMTGTATPVADELKAIYAKSVICIPTHKPCIRIRHTDVLMSSKAAKYDRIAHDVRVLQEKGQPVLIGTESVEESEHLSTIFTKHNIRHKVLNAKQDENEALTIAQAGVSGSVTIATSMAGRGTDIMLGGNPELAAEGVTPQDIERDRDRVLEAGGLFVIGTQRLDSRRLDLQLEGRSGRQGDVGASRFYLSLEDALMEEFGAKTMRRLFNTLGVEEDQGIENVMVDKSVVRMQAKKQALHAQMRKAGIRQDMVIDPPRKIIYALREDILNTEKEKQIEILKDKATEAVSKLVSVYLLNYTGFPDEWDIQGLKLKIVQWGLSSTWLDKIIENNSLDGALTHSFSDDLIKWIHFDIAARANQVLRQDQQGVRSAMLMAIDRTWQGFLDASGSIRDGIHLRAYANLKPDLVLKKEVFNLFLHTLSDLPVVMMDFAYAAIRQVEMELDMDQDQLIEESA